MTLYDNGRCQYDSRDNIANSIGWYAGDTRTNSGRTDGRCGVDSVRVS